MAKAEELAYQASRAKAIAIARTSAATIQRYRDNVHWRLYRTECIYRELGDLRGKSLLEFGCGEGIDSAICAALGAKVTGVDISPELIEVGRRRAELDGVEVQWLTGDILQMDRLGPYDIVLAQAVLHHVNIRQVLPKLLDCLRPGGVAVISEPVQPAALVRLLRRLLPIRADASPDEHPLTPDELAFVTSRIPGCAIHYYDFFGRLGRFVGGWPLRLLLMLDRALLTLIPGAAGSVVIAGRR